MEVPIIKALVLGDVGIGKTSALITFFKGAFPKGPSSHFSPSLFSDY